MKIPYSIRLDVELIKKIDKLAEKENRSRNLQIEYILIQAVSKSAL